MHSQIAIHGFTSGHLLKESLQLLDLQCNTDSNFYSCIHVQRYLKVWTKSDRLIFGIMYAMLYMYLHHNVMSDLHFQIFISKDRIIFNCMLGVIIFVTDIALSDNVNFAKAVHGLNYMDNLFKIQ